MTVEELINELKECNPKAKVSIVDFKKDMNYLHLFNVQRLPW